MPRSVPSSSSETNARIAATTPNSAGTSTRARTIVAMSVRTRPAANVVTDQRIPLRVSRFQEAAIKTPSLPATPIRFQLRLAGAARSAPHRPRRRSLRAHGGPGPGARAVRGWSNAAVPRRESGRRAGSDAGATTARPPRSRDAQGWCEGWTDPRPAPETPPERSRPAGPRTEPARARPGGRAATRSSHAVAPRPAANRGAAAATGSASSAPSKGRQAPLLGGPDASRLAHQQRTDLVQSDALPGREDRNVSVAAERAPGCMPRPGHRGVFDEEQIALVAPPPPAEDILREAEVVDQVQGLDVRGDQFLELVRVRRQVGGGFVEPAEQAGLGERLDFGAVVIRRDQDLIPRSERQGPDAVPECVTTHAKEPAAGLGEGIRKLGAGPAQVHRRGNRWPERDRAASHRFVALRSMSRSTAAEPRRASGRT